MSGVINKNLDFTEHFDKLAVTNVAVKLFSDQYKGRGEAQRIIDSGEIGQHTSLSCFCLIAMLIVPYLFQGRPRSFPSDGLAPPSCSLA